MWSAQVYRTKSLFRCDKAPLYSSITGCVHLSVGRWRICSTIHTLHLIGLLGIVLSRKVTFIYRFVPWVPDCFCNKLDFIWKYEIYSQLIWMSSTKIGCQFCNWIESRTWVLFCKFLLLMWLLVLLEKFKPTNCWTACFSDINYS